MLTLGNVPGPPRFTVLSSDGKLGVGLGTRLVSNPSPSSVNPQWIAKKPESLMAVEQLPCARKEVHA